MANKRKAKVSVERVYIPVEEFFPNLMGDAWRGPDRQYETIADVLLFTVRAMPSGTFGDAERALELIDAIRGRPDGYIELRKDDYDWMISRMKDERSGAHKIWLGPDSAYLVQHLERVKTDKLEEATIGQ